jgi:hypothetical protein
VVLLCLSGGIAFADFTIEGSTSGAFYLGSVSLGSSIDLLGLSFNGTTLVPTTVDAESPNPQANLNLGTFNLSSLLAIFNPFDFVLRVNLTAPAGASDTIFSADLRGAVVPVFGGVARIDFANNPRHFEFANSRGSGSFDLAIEDVILTNRSSRSISGSISNSTFAATPEPTSIVLISTLMVGVLFLFRKRLGSC